jgi:hypothetical protein
LNAAKGTFGRAWVAISYSGNSVVKYLKKHFSCIVEYTIGTVGPDI